MADLVEGRDWSNRKAKDPGAEKQPSKRGRKEDINAIVEEFPGMAGVLESDPHDTAASSSGGRRGKASKTVHQGDEEEEDDDALQEIFDTLERGRPDAQGLAPPRLQDFKAVPRARGDTWQGQVDRKGAAQQWCKDQNLQQTMAFNIDRLGTDVAQVLAEAWPARMQYVYDADFAGLLSTPALRADTMASMIEPPAFVALMQDATGEVKAQGARIRSIMV